MRFESNENISVTIGNLEASIISANEKYFGINLESERVGLEPSILYETLIGYFKPGSDCRSTQVTGFKSWQKINV